jgi:tetratricopeptide (TPR) repeat protein
MYSQKAYFNKSGYDKRAEEAINKAISLVPNRIEPLFFIVQIKALQNDLPEVVKTSEQIVNMVPNNAEAVWRLALAYKDGGERDKAAETAEKALSMGYEFKLVREFAWLINYYADKSDYAKVVSLYETAVQIKPNDYQLYASLATAYARNNQRGQAIAAAYKVLELNPGSKPTVDAFLQQLGAE